MENEAGGPGGERPLPSSTGKKTVIKIPSCEGTSLSDGEGGASTSSAPRPNASSFSQAFSFIKSSEFYSPPPPPAPAPFQAADQARGHDAAAQSEDAPVVGTPSTSHASSSSSPANLVAGSRNAILVSHRQRGNPLLKHIRNVRWMFADVVCDYLLGQTSCALYISLRYHLLHPDYLYYRIRELQKNFKLRVVLCHIDVEDVAKPLLEVTRTALLHDCTLLCGWSLEECGRYLETIKVYENKSADSIREQMDTDYLSRLTHALTTVRHVNKTDVVTLGSAFGSLSRVMDASMEELARCPGIGERKVKRLYDTFHEPFRRISSQSTIPSEASVQEKGPGESSSVAGSAEMVEEKADSSEAVDQCPSLSRVMDASMEELARCPGIGERKVKRLYDTFHEPFRRISSQSTIPSEASVQEKGPGESSSVAESAEIVEEKADSSEAGKEPGTTVRSALSAAFAKYSNKIRKQERMNRSVAHGEGTSAASREQHEDGEQL